MKKKIIIIVGLFAAGALLALPNIRSAIQEHKDAEKCDNAYNELLGKIMPLYNASAALGSTNEKKKEIENFYKSLSLLNDDMLLTDITEKP